MMKRKSPGDDDDDDMEGEMKFSDDEKQIGGEEEMVEDEQEDGKRAITYQVGDSFDNKGLDYEPNPYHTRYGPQREKTCLRGFANNKGADQPVHTRSLISAFVIHFFGK